MENKIRKYKILAASFGAFGVAGLATGAGIGIWALSHNHTISNKCKVTFKDGAHGKISSGAISVEVDKGTQFSSINTPQVQSNIGYEFSGWNYDGVINQDVEIEATYRLTTDTTLCKIQYDFDSSGEIDLISPQSSCEKKTILKKIASNKLCIFIYLNRDQKAIVL